MDCSLFYLTFSLLDFTSVDLGTAWCDLVSVTFTSLFLDFPRFHMLLLGLCSILTDLTSVSLVYCLISHGFTSVSLDFTSSFRLVPIPLQSSLISLGLSASQPTNQMEARAVGKSYELSWVDHVYGAIPDAVVCIGAHTPSTSCSFKQSQVNANQSTSNRRGVE